MSQIVRAPSLIGTLARITAAGSRRDMLVEAWLAEYRSPGTRSTYGYGLKAWFRWCDAHGVDPFNVLRVHLTSWLRDQEDAGNADRTIAARIGAVASWYHYLLDEEVIDRDPTARVKRPRIERVSPTGCLNRGQLHDLLAGAEKAGPTHHAFLSLLGYNGLRVAEACSIDVEDLHQEQFHIVIHFLRKGRKQGRAVLPLPTMQSIDQMLDGRSTGPLFTTRTGHRMYQKGAQRMIDRAMKLGNPAGVTCRVTPHALRHTWATLALEAGVPAQQVQHDGGWSDPRLLDYYGGHGNDLPIKAASHSVAAFTLSAA